jgi:hypothetical protein
MHKLIYNETLIVDCNISKPEMYEIYSGFLTVGYDALNPNIDVLLKAHENLHDTCLNSEISIVTVSRNPQTNEAMIARDLKASRKMKEIADPFEFQEWLLEYFKK